MCIRDSPTTALSIKTSWIGDACNPFDKRSSNSCLVCTKDAPLPPKVKEGLITSGET